jgi:hypothetical protein
MNNTRLGKTLLLALGIIGFAPTMRGADQYLKIDYPPPRRRRLQVAVTYAVDSGWRETCAASSCINTGRHHPSIEGSTAATICTGSAGEEVGLRPLGFQLSRAE